MTAIAKPMTRRVLERDGGVCVLQLRGCLGEASLADHRANRGHGGSKILNDFANLIAACGLCNGAKEDAHGDARVRLVDRGVRVVPDSTHAKTLLRCRIIPVRFPDGARYRLTSDGLRNRVLPGEGVAY